MNRRDFYIKQKVTEGELDDAFLQVEVAEQNLKADAFGPAARGFLMAPITVVEDSPQSQAVSVPTFLAWSKDGERIAKTTAAELFDFAGDEDPADPRIARLYAVFDRALSDSRVDGIGATIDFKVDESYSLERDLGTPAGSPSPPAIRTDGSILLANVTIPAAAANITNSEIDNTVQELQSDFPVGRLRNMNAGMEDAMEATAAATPSTANRVALLSDAGVTQMRGYKGTVKIVTTGAAVPTDTIDVEVATAVDGGASPDTLMHVRNAALDLGAANGPGALDVGVVANATYYVYLIGDSSGANPDDVMASLDSGPGYGGSGPSFTNAPGYDRFRLIGCIVRDAGSIVPFRQINERVYFDDETLTNVKAFGLDGLGGGSPTAFATLGLSPYCPPIAERVTLGMRGSTPVAQIPHYEFRSGGGPTLSSHTATFAFGSGPDTTEVGSESHMTLHVDASQQVTWRRDQAANESNIGIHVAGFTSEFHHE